MLDLADTMGSPVVDLTDVVRRHEATSPREVEARARFLAELERLPSPCDEHADPIHVTASAIVVGPRGTVLHLHKRLGRWMQPGGHIDAGEAPPAAALREATEELGLHVEHPGDGPQLLHVDVHEAALGHTHLDLRYLLIGGEADPDPPPGESPRARWCSWDEAMSMSDDALRSALPVARTAWEALQAT